MSTKIPFIISETNLSIAWGRAFLLAMENSHDLLPVLISIELYNGVPEEIPEIRKALDEELNGHNKYDSQTSAQTIFPYRHWIRSGKPSYEQLFAWYLTKMLPRLKARDRRNQNGMYFERMINFQGSKRSNGILKPDIKDQLAHIINIWKRGHKISKRPRQSALQVSCFDPVKDHTGQPVRGFPCLQQISFSYDDDNGLAINAYYPTQYIFDRAYGNYLGLCYLGQFMAHELDLNLVRFNCFIGHPELGDIKKGDLKKLKEQLLPFLNPKNH